MRLTEAQSRALLRTHSAHVTEACDGCGKILRPRFDTRAGRKKVNGVRSYVEIGVERKAGVCRNCSTLLNGKRKKDPFIADRTCRMRAVRKGEGKAMICKLSLTRQ